MGVLVTCHASWPGKSAKRVLAPDVPAIHVFLASDHKDVDARHKTEFVGGAAVLIVVKQRLVGGDSVSEILLMEPLMTFDCSRARDRLLTSFYFALLAAGLLAGAPAQAADEPDLIFRRSTVFKWISPNHKLATYGLDDPEVEGVACHFTVPEKGGFKGWLGVAEEVSDISLSCRQIGPIRFKGKMEQGDDMFRKRRSLIFKKMQIVRGCDAKRNVLVYMVYSDRLIEGSPKNSTSSVPIMPWGQADGAIQKCADFIQ